MSCTHHEERGHLLVALMVAIALLMIGLTAAGEKWSTIVRRDRETELIFRGQQYAQALTEYQKEHGGLPNDLEMLIKKGPKGHRYIRRLFADPFSVDGKWTKLIMAPGGQGVVNPLTQEMRPTSMLQQRAGVNPAGPGQALGPQTAQDFGLRGQRQSSRFPNRGQATPPGGGLFGSSVTQISPFPAAQLVGGPIAGVASANLKEKAFRLHEGYDKIRDFWFTVYKFPQGPGQGPAAPEFFPTGIGPNQRVQPGKPGGQRPPGFQGNKP